MFDHRFHGFSQIYTDFIDNWDEGRMQETGDGRRTMDDGRWTKDEGRSGDRTEILSTILRLRSGQESKTNSKFKCSSDPNALLCGAKGRYAQ